MAAIIKILHSNKLFIWQSFNNSSVYYSKHLNITFAINRAVNDNKNFLTNTHGINY